MHKKKKLKKMVFILIPLLLLLYITSIFFIKEIFYYNSSKSMMTYIVYFGIIFTILLNLIATIKVFSTLKKNKTKSNIIALIILLLIIGTQYFISTNLNKISSSLSKIVNNDINYSTSIIVRKNSTIKDIDDLDNKTIGMINDSNNIEGYQIPKDIIDDENINDENINYYDDFTSLLNDLLNDNIDAAFISSSYTSMFATTDGLENLSDTTKIIYEKTKKEVKDNTKHNKTLTEPFTLLLMGVDSDAESLKKSNSFNGDTLMLITFNPNTMNATILSIPRDTRVPIVCTKNKGKAKINSAAYNGVDCVTDTITNLTGIEIDYWVKVNFQAVVSLVDALGGVEVDVPYAFCEQNSKRQFGKHMIYVEKGKQTLNGEQALAFARNRHTWPEYCGKKYSKYFSNDFVRGQNQQQIINAMLNKMKDIKSLNDFYKLLDIAGENIDTNIDKDTMITGFDTFKNILLNSKNINSEDFVGTQRLYLSGKDAYINGIYYFEYYKQSLEEITDAMEINLEIKKPTLDKEFDFSINDPYENKQIGKGTYKY